MRLTLRTLLAWLDDKLPPAQVREIGKQVTVSPLAQELVQRIHRVTRQRRLTIPPRTGDEATDANLVASYLDNDLNAEQVADYEKKCLASDVNLAEVASVHQILSLLGQKVHVPHQAKARMYGLVKGREARRPAAEAAAAAVDPEPASQSVVPWVVQPPARRVWLERFGPLAISLGVLALLVWSAYESLKPDSGRGAALVAAVSSKVGDATSAVDPVEAPPPAEPAPEPPVAPTPAVAAAAVEPEAEPEPEPEPEPAKVAPTPEPVAVPAGAAVVVAKLEGMLLRFDPELNEWVRIHEKDGVHSSDRLMTPPTCSARLDGPAGALNLLPETEIRVADDVPGDGPTVDLVRGRLLAEPSSAPRTSRVSFSGAVVEMQRPADLSVGLESVPAWTYGAAAPAAPELTVYVGPGGELPLKTVQATETVKGPAAVRVDASGATTPVADAAAPDWLSGPDSSAESSARRGRFMEKFSEDRPVLADVVAATEDPDPDVKAEAVAMLRGLGDVSFLTPIMERAEDPAARRAAIAAIREELASGGAAARRTWEQLELDLGAADGARLGKLLIGFSAQEATPAVIEDLVAALSVDEPSVGLRELAFDNLRRLTGRDAPEYDPDKPEPGHAAWRKLWEEGALKPAPVK